MKPVARDNLGGTGSAGNKGEGNTARPTGDLRIGQSRFFSFARPPGWRVGEDGQYALTLLSPDSKAMTLMVGVAGSPVNYQIGRASCRERV